jgi:Arc/MetJ-type ribon-helix-helix transcriptional regulator
MRVVKVSVSISEDQAALIGREVGAGHFPSTGAVIREALREWGDRRHHHGQGRDQKRSRLASDTGAAQGSGRTPFTPHRSSGHATDAKVA